jgi:hypothetical protein
MEWVAFEKTDQRKPRTFKGAVPPEGNDGIFGTGRIKTTTGGKKGGYQYLIKTNKDDKDLRKKFSGHS